jgi:putative SOS response-associated peptidase YedK
MCGRFNLIATPEQVIEAFQLKDPPDYETSYNIPPGQTILGIIQLEDASYKAVNLQWGLIPSWAKDSKIGNRLINARAETLHEKPAFRAAYKQRRCLIPATGFYEWQKTAHGKQAFHIFRQDRQLFAFAGLWEHWRQNDETIYSCTIITRAANPLLQPIHDRMPVIIPEQHYPVWLHKDQPHASLQALLENDSGYEDMKVVPVSDWVNNPQHNDKNCLN